MSDMIRVMIVDDHSVLRDGIALVVNLAKELEVIEQASTANEVKEKIGLSQPDVVIMDIHLQEESGIELTRYMKKHYPKVKILMLTIADDEHYLQRALEAGAAGYLLKDTSSDELIHGIINVYRGDCVIPPSMTKNLVMNYKRRKHAVSSDSRLTKREHEVLHELTKGHTNKEIAHILYISDKTVKIHISNIYRKLKVKSRSQAVLYAVQNKLLPPVGMD
ncbi:response regulator [Halobacillus halophilus]|uniref:response regulator n=1 Tax=Halobacillus halophilus TaxID=1570 RepID=UPI001CD5DE1D|nr:response regulator transcription factor [Halobacillus halophilus]MCA1010118.1 response regulator transcription factor [Halobacillus halophilus]